MAAAIMELQTLLEPSTQSVRESQARESMDGERLVVRAWMVPGSGVHKRADARPQPLRSMDSLVAVSFNAFGCMGPTRPARICTPAPSRGAGVQDDSSRL